MSDVRNVGANVYMYVQQQAIRTMKYEEFITQAALHLNNLNNTIRRQAGQIEVMKAKNQELEMLVGFLKDKVIEYDPSMKAQLEFLNV